MQKDFRNLRHSETVAKRLPFFFFFFLDWFIIKSHRNKILNRVIIYKLLIFKLELVTAAHFTKNVKNAFLLKYKASTSRGKQCTLRACNLRGRIKSFMCHLFIGHLIEEHSPELLHNL